jgi:hypothetical protein
MSTYKINAAYSIGQCYMYVIYSYVVRYGATSVSLCTQILYIYVVVLIRVVSQLHIDLVAQAQVLGRGH